MKHFKIIVYIILFAGFSCARAGSYDDFFEAVGRNDGATITQLLQRGFDPGTPDAKGRTPLALALQLGHNEVAQALWQHPQLRVDQLNASGETALMIAALHGRDEWARRLVERGAAVVRDGWTPLHYAAAGPSSALVAWLLGRGAALEARAPNGTTALMMAAGYGPEASVDVLLAHGASATATNDLGLDAAAFARRAGRAALAGRLAPSRP